MRIQILGLALVLTACAIPVQDFATRAVHVKVKGNYSAIGQCIVAQMQSGRYEPSSTQYQEFSTSKTAQIQSAAAFVVALRITLVQDGDNVQAEIWGHKAINDLWTNDGMRFVKNCDGRAGKPNHG